MAYYEVAISIPDVLRDPLIERLTQQGSLGVIEQEDTVVAYFPDSADIKIIENGLSVLCALLEKSSIPGGLVFRSTLIPEQDWNETWKKGFLPIDVGDRFTVLPPWEEKHKDRINLVIDPAMAFGTGHHETTRSCLVLMERYAGKTGLDRFLDLGTGTGILALAARNLGFRTVVAADLDPLAVEATRTNAALNDVRDIEIRECGIEDLDETFDFIAANLISGVLVQLAPALAAHVGPDGIAVLSGILNGQDGEVIGAMERAGVSLLERYPDGKWVSLVVAKSKPNVSAY